MSEKTIQVPVEVYETLVKQTEKQGLSIEDYVGILLLRKLNELNDSL